MAVDAFIDTSVLIDILRGYSAAIQWAQANTHLKLAITPFVQMEMVLGARDSKGQNQALKLLSDFEMIYPTKADLSWAMQRLQQHRLKDGVGILDCLIAAPSHRLQLPLYRQNLKHFAPLLGGLAQKPY